MAVTLHAFRCHGSTWKSVFNFTYRPTYCLGKEFVAVELKVVRLSEPVLTWKWGDYRASLWDRTLLLTATYVSTEVGLWCLWFFWDVTSCCVIPLSLYRGDGSSRLHTYCMVQSPSWEANWFAASREIPRNSRNPKVHYRTHKRPPPVSILGQPNPVHIPTFHLL